MSVFENNIFVNLKSTKFEFKIALKGLIAFRAHTQLMTDNDLQFRTKAWECNKQIKISHLK